MNIKQNCWQIRTKEQAYFLKKYKSERTFQKVLQIHEALCEKCSFVVPVVGQKPPFIVYKWVEGQAANYNNRKDCRRVYNMLKNLHETGKELYTLPTSRFVEKWHYRLLQFQLLQEPLSTVLGEDYDKLLRIAKFALSKANFPQGKKTLLHGDVAHHNFLLNNTDSFIIDFDLAVYGHEAEEWALWMHRLLPHYQYDLWRVLDVVPELERLYPYYSLLAFPNEIIREWLLFVEEPTYHPHLQAMTKYYLQKWPELQRQITQY